MTAHITKLCRIALVTLTTFPLALSLNISPTRAELAPGALGDVTNVTTSIARNPLQPTPVEVSPIDNTDTDTTAAREKSMAYVKNGYEAEEAGNKELALRQYYAAMKTDLTNGYAFLFAGHLLGNDPIGIECLRVAAQLFEQQQDSEGYKVAVGLLHSANNF